MHKEVDAPSINSFKNFLEQPRCCQIHFWWLTSLTVQQGCMNCQHMTKQKELGHKARCTHTYWVPGDYRPSHAPEKWFFCRACSVMFYGNPRMALLHAVVCFLCCTVYSYNPVPDLRFAIRTACRSHYSTYVIPLIQYDISRVWAPILQHRRSKGTGNHIHFFTVL